MDAEALERLMLDRGLGALSPDCETLLAEYLDMRPEAAAACRRIDQTIDLARRALGEGPAEPLPAFPAERLLRARRSHRGWKMAGGIVGVAASILIGFGAHAILFRAAPPNAPRLGSYAVANSGGQRASEADYGSGFWSGRRLYERASTTPRQPAKLIWDSPAKVPHMGDAS